MTSKQQFCSESGFSKSLKSIFTQLFAFLFWNTYYCQASKHVRNLQTSLTYSGQESLNPNPSPVPWRHRWPYPAVSLVSWLGKIQQSPIICPEFPVCLRPSPSRPNTSLSLPSLCLPPWSYQPLSCKWTRLLKEAHLRKHCWAFGTESS